MFLLILTHCWSGLGRIPWWVIDESKTHSLLIHFSNLFISYNCLLLFRNKEILPDLYFADFYRRNGSSNKVLRSRQVIR